MSKQVAFCILAVFATVISGQNSGFDNETSTVSAQDIYDLNEEDFQLWLSGRQPKAWESTTMGGRTIGSSSSTTTRRTTTTTAAPSNTSSFDDSRLIEQLEFLEQETTPRPKNEFTQIPPTITTTTTSTSTPFDGYDYQRPETLQDLLKEHMIESQKIASQFTSGNPPQFPDKQSPAVPVCVPVNQIFNYQKGALSYQTTATIHKYFDTPQQLPFPGTSHTSDEYLSQNKPNKQQQEDFLKNQQLNQLQQQQQQFQIHQEQLIEREKQRLQSQHQFQQQDIFKQQQIQQQVQQLHEQQLLLQYQSVAQQNPLRQPHQQQFSQLQQQNQQQQQQQYQIHQEQLRERQRLQQQQQQQQFNQLPILQHQQHQFQFHQQHQAPTVQGQRRTSEFYGNPLFFRHQNNRQHQQQHVNFVAPVHSVPVHQSPVVLNYF
ncbi:transcription factor SPT20 homolog [Uranotaenia lowii]|uniref:transcription factor SPT20 homolog n=1 Tax=Uranotaenia lowii TaxID=190385 RepID=UPI0024795568|nr:transcription factor SPT20 homolog [Uranotaenia lowii]